MLIPPVKKGAVLRLPANEINGDAYTWKGRVVRAQDARRVPVCWLVANALAAKGSFGIGYLGVVFSPDRFVPGNAGSCLTVPCVIFSDGSVDGNKLLTNSLKTDLARQAQRRRAIVLRGLESESFPRLVSPLKRLPDETVIQLQPEQYVGGEVLVIGCREIPAITELYENQDFNLLTEDHCQGTSSTNTVNTGDYREREILQPDEIADDLAFFLESRGQFGFYRVVTFYTPYKGFNYTLDPKVDDSRIITYLLECFGEFIKNHFTTYWSGAQKKQEYTINRVLGRRAMEDLNIPNFRHFGEVERLDVVLAEVEKFLLRD